MSLIRVPFLILLAAVPGLAEPTRPVRLTLEVTNTRPSRMEESALWVAVPGDRDVFHPASSLSASHAYTELRDEQGNHILRFDLDALPPYGTWLVRIDADILLAPAPDRGDTPSDQDLAATALMPFRDPEFTALAPSVHRNSQQDTARVLCTWVHDHVEPSPYHKRPLGALTALRNKAGDCTESATLLATLCRMHGIPARVVGGHDLEEGGPLAPSGFHEWVECHVDGQWVSADPQQNLFDKDVPPRVVLRHGVEDQGPLQDHPRFRYTGDGLRVRLTP